MGFTYQFLMFLIALSSTGNSALFVPNAYTLAGVVAVNGSNVNGNCPSECVGISHVLRCDCLGTGITEAGVTGVLIDGTVPTLDITPTNLWASQLFTVMGGPSGSNMTIGVRFSSENPVSFREVVIYLFHCPAWGIGAESIHIYYSGSFPGFVRIFNSLGSVTVTENCDSLTRVSIPIQPVFFLQSYFIEFYNPSRPDLQWVHIGEVTFSDQPVAVPTTMEPTTTPTTMEATTATDGVSTTPTISKSVTNESTTDSTSPSSTTGDTFMSPITTDPTFTSEDSQTTTPGLPPMRSDQFTTSPSGSSTPDTQSFPAALVGALVGVIVALLVLLTIAGVVFTAVIWRIKTRAMVREDGNREYDDVVHGSEMIETKANEAYGQVTGVGGARGGALRMESTDMGTGEGEYEEIKDISYRNA